jgi:hypothetical protein
VAIALISASTPPKTKRIGNATIYLEPRISANQLAQFAVSDSAKQETIVRNAKKMLNVRVANYQPARTAMPKCHTPEGLNAESMIEYAAQMETKNFPDLFDRKCNDLSAASLRMASRLADQINCAGTRISTPSQGFDHLIIEGVRVSIQPEIVIAFAHRGVKKFGGVIFNFSKTESASLENGNGRHQAGDYAATLVFLMLGVHFGAKGGPRNANCFAVDVYRKKVFSAPGSYKTITKIIEASCRNIARQWEVVDVASETEGEEFF